MTRTVVCALLLLLALPGPALAQDKAAAQALFDDGRKLLEAGDVAAACLKFAESQRMSPLPGTLLNLANCHEKLNLLATAWGEYREGLALARADGREDRIAFVEERLAALEPRVPRLIIELALELAGVEGLVVLRDGVVLGPASIGTPMPVDPGTHVVIEARAPGHLPFRGEIIAAESRVDTVHVPRLEPGALPEPLPLAPPHPPATVVWPAPPPRGPADDSSPLRTAGWITAAAGVATALAAMGAGIYALMEESAAEGLGCSDTSCPTDDALSRSEHANDAATAVNVLLPIAATLFGAGLVMIFVPVSSSDGSSGGTFAILGSF